MEPSEVRIKPPQDLVAIFHASFHPTQGNVLDWFLKVNDNLDLSNVEFSCLPSGLHLVEQDVVYFTKDEYQGVSVFRRRKTAEHGQRGFRLSSIGILLANSTRPRPWVHVPALKELLDTTYTSLENRDALDLVDSDFDRIRVFFEDRQVQDADLGGAGDWNGWGAELREVDFTANPVSHLMHLLKILGPSCLTLYKHILGRRRILIYTLPPVEAACFLCQVAADMCYEDQLDLPIKGPVSPAEREGNHVRILKGRSKQPTKVLGMVTLNDVDKLQHESKTGRGWVACTTDVIFKEKPAYYDLLIDLTPAIMNKGCRPTFSISKPIVQPGSKGPTYQLQPIRFTWSDIKLWTELDKTLQAEHDVCEHDCCSPLSILPRHKQSGSVVGTSWPDMWRVYEDVCVVCAGMWMGPWKNNSIQDYCHEGSGLGLSSIRPEGEEELNLMTSSPKSSPYVRSVGMGIEGRPSASDNTSMRGILSNRSARSGRRASATSLLTWINNSRSGNGSSAPTSTCIRNPNENPLTDEAMLATQERQIMTTHSLLNTFATNTQTLLSRLSNILQQRTAHSQQLSSMGSPVVFTPKDLASFDLGPLSGPDSNFMEWLAQEYAGNQKIVVRRSWRDVIALLLGFS